jgi:hypothetical protein
MVLQRSSFFEGNYTSSDKEIFHQIKFEIETQNNLDDLLVKCFGCHKLGHVAKYCPVLHYHIIKSERVKLIAAEKNKFDTHFKNMRLKRKK